MIGYIVTRKHGTEVLHNIIVAHKHLANGKVHYVVVDSRPSIFSTIPSEHRHVLPTLTKPCQPIAQVDALFRNIEAIRFWKHQEKTSRPRIEEIASYVTYHTGRDELVFDGDIIDGNPAVNMQAKVVLNRLQGEQRDLHMQVVSAVNDYMDSLERVGA